MAVYDNPELSPREYVLLENQKEEGRLTREYAIKIKELEIELEREKNLGQLKLAELESKWATWLRIPITIIKLPVYVIMAFGFIVLSIRKKNPTEEFWKFIK